MKASALMIVAVVAASLSLGDASTARAQTGANRLISEARRQLDDLNADSASTLLRRALAPETGAATAERVRGLVLLGVAELSVGRADSARAAFRQALGLDPALRVDSLAELHSELIRTFEAAREAVARLPGVLEFRGLPAGARVLVDGNPWTANRGNVSPGLRRFEVTARGYSSLRDSVEVAPGATVIRDIVLLRVAMARQEVSTAVVVSPAWAANAGGPQPFGAEAKDSLGRVLSGTEFTWASLNPNVATIHATTGLATPVASGQVTVSATAGGVTGYGLFTVAIPGAAPASDWSAMTSGVGRAILGVWGTSGSDIFAVGDGGLIQRYNGTSWSAMRSGIAQTLHAVWGTSGSEVYAVGDGGTILRFDGSRWGAMPGRTGEHLFGVWGTSGTDVYAVGDGGTILHYDGTTWSAMRSATTQGLQGVWGTSGSGIYAVGTSGTIVRYDGASWSAMSSGTTQSLSAVWGSSGSDVYAVGDGGTILRYTGTVRLVLRPVANWTAWSVLRSGTTRSLRAIWGTSSSDVYAVGDGGTILRFNGTSWTAMTSGTTQPLLGVWRAGGSDVYAVGTSGTILLGQQPAIASVMVTPVSTTLRALGATQQLRAEARDESLTPMGDLGFTWTSSDTTKVRVSSTGLLTAVGNGSATITATVGRVAGTSTATVTQVAKRVSVDSAGATLNRVGASQTFTATAQDSLGQVIPQPAVTWASLNPSVATMNSSTGVATVVGSGQVTVAATVDGITGLALLTAAPGAAPVRSWGTMENVTGVWLTGVSGTSSTDVFAVGTGGAVLHYDGTGWRAMESWTDRALNAVWCAPGRHVYAVGQGGVVLRYNGASWTAMQAGTTQTLLGIWGSSGSNVYAVGVLGTILRYDGTTWSPMRSRTTQPLHAVWGASDSDIYAVGQSGTILRYNGSTWSEMLSRTSEHLFGVWGTSGTDVWAVGDKGTLLHYDGAAWSVMSSGTSQSLNGVSGTSSADIYAVGDGGTILRYDGTRWSSMPSGTRVGLWEIWGTSDAGVLAVGLATILRGTR